MHRPSSSSNLATSTFTTRTKSSLPSLSPSSAPISSSSGKPPASRDLQQKPTATKENENPSTSSPKVPAKKVQCQKPAATDVSKLSSIEEVAQPQCEERTPVISPEPTWKKMTPEFVKQCKQLTNAEVTSRLRALVAASQQHDFWITPEGPKILGKVSAKKPAAHEGRTQHL